MSKNTKLHSILSYITWIGFLIVLFMRDKDDRVVNCHLNQALILNIASTVGMALGRSGGILNLIGWAIQLVAFVLWVMGLIRAFQCSDQPLPLIGGVQLIH